MRTKARRLPLAPGLALLAGLALAVPARSQPETEYATWLGGGGADDGLAVAAGPDGSAHVLVATRSLDFLQLTGTAESPYEYDGTFLFLVTLDPQGRRVSSILLDGVYAPRQLIPGEIATAPDGSVWVAYTMTGDDWFFGIVSHVSPAGALLDRSFVSGGYAAPRDVAVDSQGNVYVVGLLQTGYYGPSPETRGTAAFLLGPVAGRDAYGLRLFDGSGDDEATAVALDAHGDVIVAGTTGSGDLFPFSPGRPPHRGRKDAFFLRLDPGTGVITQSFYLGGSGDDRVTDLALDAEDDLLLAGATSSADFPLEDPASSTFHAPETSFLVRSSSTHYVARSTFLGPGDSWSLPQIPTISIDGRDNLFWLGAPGSAGGPDLPCPGSRVVRLDAENFRPLEALCLPGAFIADLDTGHDGHLYLAGSADAAFEPVNALQPFFGGGWSDAFAAKIAWNRPPDCSGAAASPATLWPPNGRLVPVSVHGVTDPDGDRVTLQVTGVRQDEPVSPGSRFDAAGLGTPTALLRADRQGDGDGRVYHLAFEARDPRGGACTGTARVCVPHDRRSGAACGDGGALFDSTHHQGGTP